jgi:hypothetical protein
LKVRQPIAHQRQSLSLDVINTHPALPLVCEQTSGLKNLKMPGRGLPGMRKHCRDFSGSHRASIEIDREQHAASSRVGERPEDILIRVSPHSRSRLRHQLYSAILLNISQQIFTAATLMFMARSFASRGALAVAYRT